MPNKMAKMTMMKITMKSTVMRRKRMKKCRVKMESWGKEGEETTVKRKM